MQADELWHERAVLWRMRRGMLELDVLLANYHKRHYAHAGKAEKIILQQLLELSDDVLYQVLVKRQFKLISPYFQGLLLKIHQT